MKVRLTAQGIELSAELRDYVTRRVHFGLGRFVGRIKSLSVRLADINGPREGGIDKSCHIRVDAGRSQKVIVRERQEPCTPLWRSLWSAWNGQWRGN
jgi:hypothetical protein